MENALQAEAVHWPSGTPPEVCDYIIAGAGCAGLSLLVHLLHSGGFGDKKILLVDTDVKNKNDRTWCFWEKEDGPFQSIVYKEWEQLWFHAPSVSRLLLPAPYKYKLIRGIDFYAWCRRLAARHPGVTFLQAPVERMESNAEETFVVAGGKKYRARYVFNSIPPRVPALRRHQYWLLQHFKGWVVAAAEPVFTPGTATLMDLRTGQHEGTTFFYVLPFSPHRALVEYTVFSRSVIPDAVYESHLKSYVEERLNIRSYTIEEREFGVIPMTNYRFPVSQNNIYHIGTAGGQTKGSSGYTFRFIQKQSAEIVRHLLRTGRPYSTPPSGRFRFYDSVLLNILEGNRLPGDRIFSLLFSRNPPARVLKFLDNETAPGEDVKIISTLPVLPFLKSAVQHLYRWMRWVIGRYRAPGGAQEQTG